MLLHVYGRPQGGDSLHGLLRSCTLHLVSILAPLALMKLQYCFMHKAMR